MSKKFIFVLGTSFSGSTLFGSSILSHANNLSFLSEVDRFNVFGRHAKEYSLTECSICATNHAAENCPIFGVSRRQVLQGIEGIVNKYIELVAPARNIIVDSSKSVDWLNTLVDGGLRNHSKVFAIVISRNPVAFAYSNSAATKQPRWKSAIAWRETYQHTLRSLMIRKIPYISVKYDELFHINFLQQIESQLKSFVDDSLKLNLANGQIKHALGGNLGAYVAGRSNINTEGLTNSQCFDAGDTWKNTYYQAGNVEESKRWVDIGYDNAIQLMEIPGLIDISTLLGYSLGHIISYFIARY
jgi:hypothetical protein